MKNKPAGLLEWIFLILFIAAMVSCFWVLRSFAVKYEILPKPKPGVDARLWLGFKGIVR